MLKSGTQHIVALSVCEEELYAGIACEQDMLYVKHVIELLGLKVKLPMKTEMDNKGAINLANNRVLADALIILGLRLSFCMVTKRMVYWRLFGCQAVIMMPPYLPRIWEDHCSSIL